CELVVCSAAESLCYRPRPKRPSEWFSLTHHTHSLILKESLISFYSSFLHPDHILHIKLTDLQYNLPYPDFLYIPEFDFYFFPLYLQSNLCTKISYFHIYILNWHDDQKSLSYSSLLNIP